MYINRGIGTTDQYICMMLVQCKQLTLVDIVTVGVTINDTDISTGQRGPRRYPINSRINLTITVNSVHCE